MPQPFVKNSHYIRGAIIHSTAPKMGPQTSSEVQTLFKKTLSLVPENREVINKMKEGYYDSFSSKTEGKSQNIVQDITKTDIKLFKYAMFESFTNYKSIYHYTNDPGRNLSPKNTLEKIPELKNALRFEESLSEEEKLLPYTDHSKYHKSISWKNKFPDG